MSKTASVASIPAERATRWLAICAVAAVLAGCGAGSANLRADNAGQLAPCDSGPHCVSSQASDPARHVDPIAYSGPRATARQRLEQVIAGMAGARIVEQKPDYIHAEYTSALMHFVDDVEFVLPAGSHVIQVRSSSRIGYYDFGVNRARVESIRKRFEAAAAG